MSSLSRVLCLISFISTLGIALPFSYMATLILEAKPWLSPICSLSPELTYGLVVGLFPFGQFLSGPIVGALGDRLGYRLVLSTILCLSILGFAISAWCLYDQNTLLFAVSRFLTGMTEGTPGLLRAYIATSTPINLRAKAFATQNNCMVAGWLMGPPLGSLFTGNYLLTKPAYWLPFCLASAIAAIAFTLFLKTTPKNFPIKKAKTQIKNPEKPMRVSELAIWFVISFLITLGLDGYYQFYPALLVSKHHTESNSVAIVAVLMTTGIILANRLTVSKVKKIDTSILVSGFLICSALIFISNIKDDFWILLCSPFLGLAIAYVTSLIPTKISTKIPESEQGFLLSFLASTRSLGDTIICMAGSILISSSPESPILISAASVFAAIILLGLKCKITR